MERAYIYKGRVKCFKCTCINCGCDRGYQPIRNVNAMCVTCMNRKKGPKSESFKEKMSIKMKGNKNRNKLKASLEIQKERKKQYSKKASIRNRIRYKNDINYRMTCILRSRLRVAVKSGVKTGSGVRDLGCSIEEFKIYLESKFQPGMTWENWTTNGWHLDHVKPLCSFDLTDREQLKQACHYTNLQPLWSKDNIIKGGK